MSHNRQKELLEQQEQVKQVELSLEELVKKVKEWGYDKGILPDAEPIAQASKTCEEAAELFVNCVKDNKEEIKDAIGDILVTLILQGELSNFEFEIEENIYDKFEPFNSPTEFSVGVIRECTEIPEVLIATSNEDYIKGELKQITLSIINDIGNIAYIYNWSLRDCLQHSYNIISKRTGKMVNGVFVKDK